MKQCRRCGETLHLSAYYEHPQMADGYLNICKECTKRRISNDRDTNLGKHRQRDAIRYYSSEKRREQCHSYSKTSEGKAAHIKVNRKWRDRNPEKYKAQTAVNNAIRDGKLKRQACEVCGEKAQAHHDDYAKPLDVRWLCSKHHMERHRKHAELGKAA